eukprot:CAMPEP_0114976726 /NCGR_PEP_ID=MMETSP0216-20121206/2835_1 /TAXON_ID=223996 /ORGANISM="Protocruzia adherens, Strain Boccale" /LENGTH=299 /DNA_ID=CAMNT_0002337691 /DNA_START=213 /DNA_END=1112 /DNA_ORIENTATION=-
MSHFFTVHRKDCLSKQKSRSRNVFNQCSEVLCHLKRELLCVEESLRREAVERGVSLFDKRDVWIQKVKAAISLEQLRLELFQLISGVNAPYKSSKKVKMPDRDIYLGIKGYSEFAYYLFQFDLLRFQHSDISHSRWGASSKNFLTSSDNTCIIFEQQETNVSRLNVNYSINYYEEDRVTRCFKCRLKGVIFNCSRCEARYHLNCMDSHRKKHVIQEANQVVCPDCVEDLGSEGAEKYLSDVKQKQSKEKTDDVTMESDQPIFRMPQFPTFHSIEPQSLTMPPGFIIGEIYEKFDALYKS